tara:strand:+ start:391 stop:603 length:213 start_codon:yes stop_codon:yes gene_type:complete
MEKSKLSWMYFHACDRMHQVIDDLYEALHEEEGEPLETKSRVDEAMDGVKMALYQELDLISSSASEHEGG